MVLVLGCKSAAILGPACIQKECIAFSGYDEAFTFISKDPYIEGFKDCALELFAQLARGATLGSAQASTRTMGERYLLEWHESAPDFISPMAIASLLSNIKHQIVIGDLSVKLP